MNYAVGLTKGFAMINECGNDNPFPSEYWTINGKTKIRDENYIDSVRQWWAKKEIEK